jgi:hypothetical protein
VLVHRYRLQRRELLVRHAYFLGANDPYKALKTTLKAEINEDAWATLNSSLRESLKVRSLRFARPTPMPRRNRLS